METQGRTESTTPALTDGSLVSRAARVDARSLVSLLSVTPVPNVLWAGPDESTMFGFGAAAMVSADGPGRFETMQRDLETVFTSVDHDGPVETRPRAFGGFAFHDEHEESDRWSGFPGSHFVIPRYQFTIIDEEYWLSVNEFGRDASVESVEQSLETGVPFDAPVDMPSMPAIADRTSTTDVATWRDQVDASLARIQAGELTKVVLAQALSVRLESDVPLSTVLERLEDTYPDCYRFMYAPTAAASFFGATPERLVTLRGRTVVTEALAGSTGRGDTPAEDRWLAEELLASTKDRHEHDLVVEAIGEQLSTYVKALTTDSRTVRKLATVQHLRTPITAELRSDEHVFTLVKALHPTPAVGGLPPDRAWETIRDAETFDRGWYASPIGWVDADGDGTFAVGIRSAVAAGDTATLFAGAGIVADSEPNREWDEVQLKYRPIMDALE